MKFAPGTTAPYLMVAMLVVMAGCGESLESHHGPATGLVSGVVCDDLTTLTAVNEMPSVGKTLIQEGKCLNPRNAEKVNFIRTVVMPGDGEYSQFEYQARDKLHKLWIRTEKVKAG